MSDIEKIVKLTGKKADLEKAKEIGLTDKVINKLKAVGLIALTSLAVMLPNANVHAENIAYNDASTIQLRGTKITSVSKAKEVQQPVQEAKNASNFMQTEDSDIASKIEAQKEEAKNFYKYIVKNKIDINNKSQIQIIKNHILNMAKLELEKSGHVFDKNGKELTRNFQLDIFDDFKADQSDKKYLAFFEQSSLIKDGEVVTQNPMIVFNLPKLIHGKQQSLLSDSPRERLEKARLIDHAIIHEIEHHHQLTMVENSISSKEALTYANEAVIVDLIPEFYINNYIDFTLENRANLAGNKSAQMLGNNSQDIKLDYKVLKAQSKIGFYMHDGKINLRNEMTADLVDNFICNDKNLEILEAYPIFEKIYNEDGTRKSALELTNNLQEEIDYIIQNDDLDKNEKIQLIKDTQEMHYEYIYRVLNINPTKETSELVKGLGKEDTQKLFNSLKKYSDIEYAKKTQDIKELSDAKIDYIVEKNQDSNEARYEIQKEIKMLKNLTNKSYKKKINTLNLAKNSIDRDNDITPQDITNVTASNNVTISEIETVTTQTKLLYKTQTQEKTQAELTIEDTEVMER